MTLRSLSRVACAGVLLGAGLMSSAASAQEQPWLKDRRYTEGPGYRTGDLEIHPGIAGEVGYDSNYFLRASSEKPIETARLRLTPSLALSTLSAQRRVGDTGLAEPAKVDFRSQAALSFSEFIPTQSTTSDQVKEQRNVAAIANVQLSILPHRPWGGSLFGDFVRSVQPSQNPDANFNRMVGRVGGDIAWQPGGGVFDWRLGYEFAAVAFQDDAFKNLGTTQSTVSTRGRWRFLPRTAWMYDASIGFIRYTDSTSPQRDSDPVRARIGINGLVTPSFALLAMAGWGSSFYNENQKSRVSAQQFDGPIGQAELRWFITPNPSSDPAAATLALSSIAVGYQRDFFNSYLGEYYTRDRGYLNLSHFFSGRLLVVVDGGAARIGYPQFYVPASNTQVGKFADLRVDASLFAEYRFVDSFGVNVTGRYTANISDKKVPIGAGVDDLAWTRLEAYLGVRWLM